MNPGLYSSEDSSWATPQDIYDKLNKMFGPFNLDPAASDDNHKCEKYYTRTDNGLRQSWYGHLTFLNPPYGNQIIKWVRKCCNERYHTKLICALLPSRTDTQWWHEYVLNKANSLHFVRGRIKFEGSYNSAPFPSVIAIYLPAEPEISSLIYSLKF